MEYVSGGVQRQRRERFDRRLAPAAVFKSCDRHVIAENGAELSHWNSNPD
jgi:hypothetical protein